MKTFLVILLLLFASQSKCQFLHKADSLFYSYSKTLKKKKPSAQVTLQQGRSDYSRNEPNTYLSKVDSLKIISVAAINGQVEVALFDDMNPPQLTILDSCALFQLIATLKESLMQTKQYLKSQVAAKRLGESLKSEIQHFETLSIQLKDSQYSYRIADKTRDFEGNNLTTETYYKAAREVMDAVYALVRTTLER